MGKALFPQKSRQFSTTSLLQLFSMTDSQQTQTDPLIALIAQQAALQLQIDRLIAQRATPSPTTEKGPDTVSASASASPSQRISAMERLGRRGRKRASRGHSAKTRSSRADGEDELSSEGESRRTIPSLPPTDPQVNMVRAARSWATVHTGATVQNRVRGGGGRPPLPPHNRENGPRASVFDRIAHKDSIKEVEKRLRSEMRNQMPSS